jgi:hypothetical protein
LKKDPTVEDVRKNQAQVDAQGNKVGDTRPDVQYNKPNEDGVKEHHITEHDTTQRSSDAHRGVSEKNDSNAKVDYRLVGMGGG